MGWNGGRGHIIIFYFFNKCLEYSVYFILYIFIFLKNCQMKMFNSQLRCWGWIDFNLYSHRQNNNNCFQYCQLSLEVWDLLCCSVQTCLWIGGIGNVCWKCIVCWKRSFISLRNYSKYQYVSYKQLWQTLSEWYRLRLRLFFCLFLGSVWDCSKSTNNIIFNWTFFLVLFLGWFSWH